MCCTSQKWLLSFGGSCQLVIFSPTCKQEGFGGWYLRCKEKKGGQEDIAWIFKLLTNNP